MAASSYVGLASTVSPPPSPPPPPPSSAPPASTAATTKKKNKLSEQLQPFSKHYLQRGGPPSRGWASPNRRKARDAGDNSRRRGRDASPSFSSSSSSPVSSSVRDTIALLQQEKDSDVPLASLLDNEISLLTCKDIVAILNAQTCWRRSLLFFDWLRSRSFVLNSYVYNVMLRILRAAQQWETGKVLVEDMIRDGVQPDNVTYSTIISFAIRCNRYDEALDWFSRMQDSGCLPDSVTYSAVIDLHVKSGRIKNAEVLCSKMQREIQPWDSVVYSQIMKLHGLQKDYDQMWEVYKKMLAKNMSLNLVTYNSVIALLGDAGRSMQAQRVFNDMLEHGLKPSPVSLSLMFKSFAKTKQVDEALELYERMKKEGWAVDSVVYNSILSLCAQLGKVDEGEMICRELLKSRHCRPDDWTWRTIVDMYVKGGKFEEARRITKEMLDRGRVMDLPVYMGLIQGYGRRGDFKAVVELFDEVKASNMPLDHMLAGALLATLVRCEESASEETLPLLDRIGMVYPKLRTVVDNLSKEDLSTETIKEDMQSMLNGASEDCRRPLCNLLMDLCWVKKSAVHAHELLSIAVSFGLYPDLQVRSALQWRLKLKMLSFGAAQTALRSWLSSLRAALEKDGELPSNLSIEVGVGVFFPPNQSSGTPVMKTVILKLLQEMGAPFCEGKLGWLTANGEDVKGWLLSPPEASAA